jgi:16S rRNA (cytidine1402-2'-O)-methyltransferase
MAELYVVASPIGNLEDITYRAVRILKEVVLIACEDTRHTRRLLDHYGIATRLVSYHEHNEETRAAELLDRLTAGDSVALMSDAGTPLISDPGYRVVAAVAAAGIQIVPIPGPSALIAALSASGLPTDSFRFCGFLPAKASQRRRTLESLAGETATLVFYEAPHRIVESIGEIRSVLGNRPAVLARELTKIHEEFLRGRLDEIHATLAGRLSIKGEITILIGRGGEIPAAAEPVADAVRRLESEGVPRMDAMKRVARERGISKREVYRIVERSADAT